MKRLGESPPGFSEDPLFFTVSTPTALDVVVFDLPGPGPVSLVVLEKLNAL